MSVDPGKESVMNEYESVTRKLCDFIAGAPSCYHAITQGTLLLEKAGFQRLSEQEHWELVPGKSYYVIRSGSSMIAFHIPVRSPHHFQIVASHSDSPSFRIKEDPEIRKADHYVTLNIESYGGMLKAPWFDRPLGVAGRLMVCEDSLFLSNPVYFRLRLSAKIVITVFISSSYRNRHSTEWHSGTYPNTLP